MLTALPRRHLVRLGWVDGRIICRYRADSFLVRTAITISVAMVTSSNGKTTLVIIMVVDV